MFLVIQDISKEQIQNLKLDYEIKIKGDQKTVDSLKIKLQQKSDELDELLRMYKKMKDEIMILTEQQASKKNINLKFAGASTDLIATKNLFDVMVKNKVRKVCLDDKESEDK